MRPAVLPDQATDAEVIGRSVHDPDLFSVLFDRHYGAILGYVGRRLYRDAAEDVASEVFLIAFRKRRDYDTDRADARPWLFGIATNLIGRHRRDEARFYQSLARNGLDLVGGDTGDAENTDARLTAQAARRRLATALAGLSAKDRDVVTLVAFAELGHDDVAQVLSIPPGTVKSRLHRARKQLRAALGDLDPAGVLEEESNDG